MIDFVARFFLYMCKRGVCKYVLDKMFLHIVIDIGRGFTPYYKEVSLYSSRGI